MRTRIKSYAIGIILGLLSGLFLYYIQPVQWQGQGLVRIGQISQNQNQNQNQSQTQSIEPLATVIERLKSRSFIQAVARRANRNEVEKFLDVSEGSALTIKPTKNSDSLIITVNGRSMELVQTSIDSIVAELASKHDVILEAYQADVRKELARLGIEIDVLSKRLAVMLDGPTIANSKVAEEKVFVTGFRIMATQHELDNKFNRSSLLRESISSINIRPTGLVEPTSISKKRILSSLLRAGLLGALLGALLSMIWIQWKK